MTPPHTEYMVGVSERLVRRQSASSTNSAQHHHDKLTWPNTFHCAMVLNVSITSGLAIAQAHIPNTSSTHPADMTVAAWQVP